MEHEINTKNTIVNTNNFTTNTFESIERIRLKSNKNRYSDFNDTYFLKKIRILEIKLPKFQFIWREHKQNLLPFSKKTIEAPSIDEMDKQTLSLCASPIVILSSFLLGTFNIGRKDRLWKNYHKLRLKYGKEEFSFLPRTFCLPADTKLLKKVWEKRGCRAKWIVKPPALARGTGISVVNKWSQIPKTRPLIVQKYVAKPHLINDTKYDLR